MTIQVAAKGTAEPSPNGSPGDVDLLFRAPLPEWAGEPAFDDGGHWPLPVAEIHEDKETGARLILHAYRQVAGRSVLSTERLLSPRTGRGIAHRHMDFDQQFVVRAGTARYRIGRRTGTLESGEELTIERGVPHVDPYNDSDEPVELLNLMSPGPWFPFVYGRTLGQALFAGKLNEQHELPLLYLMVVLRETRAQTFAAGPPIALQRLLVVPLLAFIGRRMGYRAAVW